MDNLWQQFVQTGSVADYLKYKEQQAQEQQNHADNRQRPDYQGTDHRGE